MTNTTELPRNHIYDDFSHEYINFKWEPKEDFIVNRFKNLVNQVDTSFITVSEMLILLKDLNAVMKISPNELLKIKITESIKNIFRKYDMDFNGTFTVDKQNHTAFTFAITNNLLSIANLIFEKQSFDVNQKRTFSSSQGFYIPDIKNTNGIDTHQLLTLIDKREAINLSLPIEEKLKYLLDERVELDAFCCENLLRFIHILINNSFDENKYQIAKSILNKIFHSLRNLPSDSLILSGKQIALSEYYIEISTELEQLRDEMNTTYNLNVATALVNNFSGKINECSAGETFYLDASFMQNAKHLFNSHNLSDKIISIDITIEMLAEITNLLSHNNYHDVPKLIKTYIFRTLLGQINTVATDEKTPLTLCVTNVQEVRKFCSSFSFHPIEEIIEVIKSIDHIGEHEIKTVLFSIPEKGIDHNRKIRKYEPFY